MQTAIATKSEEKKKTAPTASRLDDSVSDQPLREQTPASLDLPLFLRSRVQTAAGGAEDDPTQRAANWTADRVAHGTPLLYPLLQPRRHIQRKCSGCPGPHKCSACQQEERRVQTRRSAGFGYLPIVQRACACGGTCASCSGSMEEESPALLQRQLSPGGGGGVVDGQIIPEESPGHPLDDSTRSFMESRFGSDFSDVRVHTDSRAAQSADALSADAYTTGRDIYFAAGKYDPASQRGKHLLAHELTHTQQQAKGATPLAASSSAHVTVGAVHDPLEAEAEHVADTVVSQHEGIPQISRDGASPVRRFPPSLEELAQGAASVGQSIVGGAESAVSDIRSGAQAAGRWVGEKVEEGAQVVEGAVSDAASWLESEAGKLAQTLASSFGVGVTVTPAGLLITVPRFCPLDALSLSFKLPSLDKKEMVPVVALPLGPVVITGEVGVTGHVQPKAEIQIGPFCLNGVTILINPITNTYSITGSVSATAGASLSAEVRGGLRGELNLKGVVVIGGVPVPIEIPLLGLEGGLAGLFRGIGAGTLTIGGSLTISHGVISMAHSGRVDLGAAADLFVGAYAQLDVLGENVCRIYWQPYEWHGDVAGSIGVSVGLTIIPGGRPALIPTVTPPTFSTIPFDSIPLILSRKGFSDDCPIKDRICELLTDLHLLPSQNGGSWSWSGPYGPGPRLPGPLEVYQKNPGIASGSQCRGACGPNCDTCESKPTYSYKDPATGDVWEYTNFQDCNSNGGCREHDAAFDWAADKHGETGRFAIIMPWHMAANIECTCNNLAGNCIAWIVGLPPYDSKMYFADTVVRYASAAVPPSTAVPSIDEATHSQAETAIASGDCAQALQAVLATLVDRGQINASLANWSYVARSDRGEGVTNFTWVEDPDTHERRARAPVTVQIFTPACKDVGWLFSTVMHEYVHVLQVLAGAPASEFGPKGAQGPEFVARDEVEAYLWEIEHALGSGLINNPGQMQDVGRRLTTQFLRMTPALQAIYQVRYDAAQRRVLAAVAHRPGMSIEEARRIVQESSREIAELLRMRPGNEAVIDSRIEEIRRRRAAAMIEVALVDNPVIQVVRPGDPGTYRVPTVDGEGRVRYLHGGIQVAWHMAATSTSAYSLGEGIGAGGDMAIAGTAIQGRVHPFPPDIDFDEHIHVVADTKREAGMIAAGRIIASIRRISGGPVPGRTDIEFRHLLTFPSGGRGIRMSLGEVLGGGALSRLGRAISMLNGGNINTFWRGMLADGRFTNVTRVIFISANRRDGTPLITMGGSAEFNLAFLDDPGELPSTNLAQFAWDMCCDAVRRADVGSWLKAGKRAYNYFSTTGDMAHMRALEPVFLLPETEAEQYATVIDSIQLALVTRDMGVRQARTRILTVDEAQHQVEEVARTVETILPDSGSSPNPAAIARELRNLARELRPRNARGQLAQDDILAGEFGAQADAIRKHIDTGVRDQVQPIIDGFVRPVCPDRDACRRRR